MLPVIEPFISLLMHFPGMVKLLLERMLLLLLLLLYRSLPRWRWEALFAAAGRRIELLLQTTAFCLSMSGNGPPPTAHSTAAVALAASCR
jgi:hypothetical protein